MRRAIVTSCATGVAIASWISIGLSGCAPTATTAGIPFNLPPTPTITTDVIRGVAPLTVNFNSDRSTDDGLIVSRLWDFADESTSQEISPRHTFTATGDYVVTLTLTDDSGTQAAATQTIAVTEAPVPVIAVDPGSAEAAPAVFEFDGTASFDPDGEIVGYQWDFGDSSREFLVSVTHVYASSGTYRATLTVTDDKGVTASTEQLIAVGIPTPTIEIRVPPRRSGQPKVTRSHVTATQTGGASHTLEAVGSDNGTGWGEAAVGDLLIFDTETANNATRVQALAVDGDTDKISVFSLSSTNSIAAADKTVEIFGASNIVLSPDSPLWTQAVYDVEAGTAHFTKAGLDRDLDQCEAQSVLYDLGNGASVQVLTGHDDRVNDVAFAPSGSLIATCSDDWTVRLHDAASGVLIAAYTGASRINAVAFSPDSSRLALAQSNGDVVLVNIVVDGSGTMTLVRDRTLSSHTAGVNDVEFSPEGTQVLSGANDRRAILWSVADGTILRDSQHTLGVNAVAFSPRDPVLVATGSEQGNIRMWNNTSGAELVTLIGHEGPVNDLAFSADGSTLLTASDDNTARAWDPFSGAPLVIYAGHNSDVVSVAISADGTTVVTGSSDWTARVWDGATAETIDIVQPCLSTISAVAISPDGERFVAGVAARNDIPLDTDPPSGNDLNISYPQGLSLASVPALGGQDVPAGRYYVWAEIDTDQQSMPVRTYANTNVNVIDAFSSTVGPDAPIIPLVNDQAAVVLPTSEDRQVFDLGALNRGDRLHLSLLSTPGFGEFYTPRDEFSVMVLDANQSIFAWYQALQASTGALFGLPVLDEFVLFSPDTKLVVGHNSAHYYVVVDGGVSVNVRLERGANLFDPRSQRVLVQFGGGGSIAAGNQPPRTVPEFDAADFNQYFAASPNWGSSETDIMKLVIMQILRNIYVAYDVEFFSSDDAVGPALPFQTVYVGGETPAQFLGISDYVDPRNDTATGIAIVYASEIAEVGIGGGFANSISSENDLGAAIGTVAAHQVGQLLGLRNTADSTDIMQGSLVRQVADPTIPRILKASLVSDSEQVGDLDPIGIQDAPLLLEETVGLAP